MKLIVDPPVADRPTPISRKFNRILASCDNCANKKKPMFPLGSRLHHPQLEAPPTRWTAFFCQHSNTRDSHFPPPIRRRWNRSCAPSAREFLRLASGSRRPRAWLPGLHQCDRGAKLCHFHYLSVRPPTYRESARVGRRVFWIRASPHGSRQLRAIPQNAVRIQFAYRILRIFH